MLNRTFFEANLVLLLKKKRKKRRIYRHFSLFSLIARDRHHNADAEYRCPQFVEVQATITTMRLGDFCAFFEVATKIVPG